MPRRLLLGGRIDWRFRTGDKPEPLLRRVFATIWGVNLVYNVQQWAAERPTAWRFARQQRQRARRGERVLDASSAEGVGMHTELKMRLFGVVGVAMTYVVWAVMSWIIFTYVRLRLGRPLARAARPTH